MEPTRQGVSYSDPLDAIWVEAARRIGFRVVRTADAYASTDGRGTLLIAEPAQLDPDDSLAQMIFHELCHSLVEGHDGLSRIDWGLDNESARDLEREWACLRLQALLSDELGLRVFFAPTTDHRAFYDALPGDPLSPPDEPSVVMARAAAARVDRPPWSPHLRHALLATVSVTRAAQPFAAAESLFARVAPARPRHPAGFPLARIGGRVSEASRCGSCAWAFTRRGRLRCRQAKAVPIEASQAPCDRYEPALLCQACGACCREAYQTVELGPREAFARRHPALVVVREGRAEIARRGDRCAALDDAPGGFACRVYADRPRTCRDFTLGSEHCLEARRRVGLSR